MATVPFTVRVFLREHIRNLVEKGHQVTVCLNMEGLSAQMDLPEGVTVHSIPIQRDISLRADLYVLASLARFLLQERFDVVHSISPKSGLIGMLAARMAGVRHRIHSFTGQVWSNTSGVKRAMLKWLDRLLAACATEVLADSKSQRSFLVAEGVVEERKICVLAEGSMCGVDVARFRACAATRAHMRSMLGVQENEVLLLFVGRMKREKGVWELAEAYSRLRSSGRAVRLLLVGHDEEGFAVHWAGFPGLEHVPYVPNVEDYFAAGDIFCLPSHREGFGSVLIEAGAASLPVVASRIYGITDAVVDGETGLLHRPRDIDALVGLLERLIEDPALRIRLGEAGRLHAETKFETKIVTNAFSRYYQKLAAESQKVSGSSGQETH